MLSVIRNRVRLREQRSLLLAGVCFGFMVLGVSYLDEDAFISFRVVDNFVNGYGLRWNVDERVQVFTHPLWVLLLIPLHALFRDIAVSSYLLSWTLSCAAFLLVGAQLSKRRKLLFFGLLLPLLVSQSFTDYTSSGLENPLVFLWLALLARQLFNEQVSLRWVVLLAAFAAISRPDTPLMFLPAVAWLLWVTPWRRAVMDSFIGAIPALLWALFALGYYGILFPNPKYAKLNGGVERSVYLEHGWLYLLDVLRNDTVTFVGLVLAPCFVGAVVVVRGRAPIVRSGVNGAEPGASPSSAEGAHPWRAALTQSGAQRAALLLGGVVLYQLYVIWIGGDFMAGRHWAAPYFLTVSTLSLWSAQQPADREDQLSLAVVAVVLFARFGLQPLIAERDVIEERSQDRYAMIRSGQLRVQRFNCGFFEALFAPRGGPEKHSWSRRGLKDRDRARAFKRRHPNQNYVVGFSAAGKAPFFAGPEVIYVDTLGIVDPLLARLPDADGKVRIIGHLGRKIPRGYLEARRKGNLSGMHPDLARYYEHLRQLTSAPLFSSERWHQIAAWNSGQADVYLERYLKARDGSRYRERPWP